MLPEQLSHYRVLRRIGSGGMGEVYLAEDQKLGRKVALKVLAASLAHDRERRDRFEREARAVAALNHPNIVTIHSVEQHDGLLFLTMELLEGRSLTDLIPPGGMAIASLLQVALPLADAVAAAHQRGITHRDLKPANVMVTDEERVKVLDFGLAKVQDTSAAGDATAMTAAGLTVEGHILGTVAYMSPEQAQGRPVDARSDIFSLGIVLFEMATGRRPFEGENNVAVLSAILKDAPVALTDLRADVPPDLARIVRRCLAKDPDERYQTAKDLRTDLKLLQQDLDTAVVTRDATRAPASRMSTRSGIAAVPARRRWPFLLGGVAALGLIGAFLVTRSSPPQAAREPFGTFGMQRLTNTGSASLAAISPDGRYVVHVVGATEKPSLWLRQVSTKSNVQILPPIDGEFVALTFSPDGERILYVTAPHDPPTALYELPLLGGPARHLADGIDSAPAFSPDGRRMAFVRGVLRPDQRFTFSIVLANPDATSQRVLASRDAPDEFQASGLAWSPDGRELAAFIGAMPRKKSRIVRVDVSTGSVRDLTRPAFDFPGSLVWMPDGRSLLCDAVEQGQGIGSTSQIWSVSVPDGAIRRITNDVASYKSMATSRDGRSLVAVQDETRAAVWIVPEGDASRARALAAASTSRDGMAGLDWTPDGRIVYGSMAQGSWDLWIARPDGGPPVALTSDPGVEGTPDVLPDGSGVAFMSRAAGQARFTVRAIGLDGSHARELYADDVQPGFVQVGAHDLYVRRTPTWPPVVFRVPLAGGPAVRLLPQSQYGSFFFPRRVSPDERLAAGLGRDPAGGPPRLTIVPLDGTGAARFIPLPFVLSAVENGFRWTPDGTAIDLAGQHDGVANVWRVPLDGGPPRQITRFTSDRTYGFAWSRDGKALAISRGSSSSDVVLLTDSAAPTTQP